jgi:mannose-6-phosphate isomerase-like protein (cupin superfamily)
MRARRFLSTIGATLLVVTSAAPAGVGPLPVTYIPSDKVTEGFAKGSVLFAGPVYMVHASRREAPGQVEVHQRDTDIIYVLEGSSTFVTGGVAMGTRVTAPDELRGSSIDGGEIRRLTKGDVIIVPEGTPHWFKEVQGPLLYYVVKVRQAAPGGSGVGR